MQALQETLCRQIASQAPDNGITTTRLPQVVLLRESRRAGPLPWLYEPILIIAAQGKKHVYLNGKPFHYDPGHFLTVLMPMALECELREVSEAKPLLGVGIRLDLARLTQLLLKIDRVREKKDPSPPTAQTGMFTTPLQRPMLEATVGLLQTLQEPTDAAILGEPMLDEVYYRLLMSEKGGSLGVLLRHQGKIHQIARVIENLQAKLTEKISVEDLAESTGMSSSNLRKHFKEVMQLSPLQYIKFLRLNKARNFLFEGKNAAETAYLVGYNSPAQFSREYKRQFGMPPSETRSSIPFLSHKQSDLGSV